VSPYTCLHPSIQLITLKRGNGDRRVLYNCDVEGSLCILSMFSHEIENCLVELVRYFKIERVPPTIKHQ